MKNSIQLTRIILVLFISTAFLFSCDPDDTNPIDELVGTWDVTNITTVNCTDPDDNEPNLITCFTEFGFEICGSATLVIDADGNLTTNFVSTITELSTNLSQTETESETSTFTVDGNRITICSDGDCETAIYAITGNTLTLSNDGSTSDGCQSTISGVKR
ncbi:lipocalin family protein [Roseivirga sp.]|uniref:lipocalin family protein n=1 Tax=Roseivirga sp. TaxID=1964215 RepID=UPI003B8D13DD